MALGRARGYLPGMKRWFLAIMYLWPGATLLAVGLYEAGHAPTWVSVTLICVGILSAIPGLSVVYLWRRIRTLRTNAQGS